jgi:hypothetical protein|tara:strand:- start:114 stop:620 length:507 start_codon:yes stop_codon:yes gene_type:complete
MKKNTIIFDLDGTLANIDKRKEFATKSNGKLDWDVFFSSSNIKLDVPNEPVVKMAQMFAENGFNVVIFSGRNDRSFHTTRSWLTHNRIPFQKLIMRPDKFLNWGEKIADGNIATQEMRFMPDEILKKHMLDLFVDINDVFLVVDDRNKVVDMWRSLGLTVFQVAEGDF